MTGAAHHSYSECKNEGSSDHGNNERIGVDELRRGSRVLTDVVA